MEQFTDWLEKRDPEFCEGIGIVRIAKQMFPGGGMTIMKATRSICLGDKPKNKTIKGTGPNKESALKNALEKIDGKPGDVQLIDKDNDVYTFRVKR